MNFTQLIADLKLNAQEFYFQFNSHPEYPSALALSDTLNFLGVRNEAYELEKEYWEELPDEFITLFNDQFTLVKKQANGSFKLLSESVSLVTKEELYQKSQDFVLLIEKNGSIDQKKSTMHFSYFLYILFGILAVYSFLNLNWYEAVFNCISLAGVYIFLELFNQKFGGRSPVINNICGGEKISENGQVTDCKQLISSDKTNILGLKIADLGLVYFLSLVFIGFFLPSASVLFKYLSVASVAVILYSLYLQLVVEKNICKICMVIIGLLIAQLLLSLLFFANLFVAGVLLQALFFFILSFGGVRLMSENMADRDELIKSNQKNLRFKRNYNSFKREMISREKVNFKEDSLFFTGNKSAKIHLSIVTHPYCGYCGDAHQLVADLLEKYPDDISAQIRFNYFAQNAQVKYTELMGAFLFLYENFPQQQFMDAVHLWFTNKDESALSARGKSEHFERIEAVAEENRDLNLTFTPIILINGYAFPDQYDRADLRYFIGDLIEDEDFNQ